MVLFLMYVWEDQLQVNIKLNSWNLLAIYKRVTLMDLYALVNVRYNALSLEHYQHQIIFLFLLYISHCPFICLSAMFGTSFKYTCDYAYTYIQQEFVKKENVLSQLTNGRLAQHKTHARTHTRRNWI